MKKVIFRRESKGSHWVGDGFPVRTVFSYGNSAQELSPFLLMDYAGPADFPPSNERRGVGEHPHRGFETVTIVYAGEVEHRDSGGGGGRIGPGDVQWMTAASGVVHEEMHGEAFAKAGGKFEMVQLWVNLPAKDKMSKPRYQELTTKQIPSVNLPQDAGTLRVIAGSYEGFVGPAKTFTPMSLWDVRLKAGKSAKFHFPEDHNCAVFVLSGEVRIGNEVVKDAQLAGLETSGDCFEVSATADTKLLILGGEGIEESIAGYGPFVMNTKAEIDQALKDYKEGRLGKL